MIIKHYVHYSEFKKNQRDTINSVACGKDVR